MVNKDEIRRALDEATSGRWHYYSEESFIASDDVDVDADWDDEEKIICEAVYDGRNARLIANAPTWLRELLAELDAKDAEIARLQEAIKGKNRMIETMYDSLVMRDNERKAAERERDELEKEVFKAAETVKRWHDNYEKCRKERNELRQQNAELREVLKWYGEPRNQFPRRVVIPENASPVEKDGGQRARTILDRYKDTQPEVQHECPCCGSDLDFYRDTATCPNDDCDYQAPYREDTQGILNFEGDEHPNS